MSVMLTITDPTDDTRSHTIDLLENEFIYLNFRYNSIREYIIDGNFSREFSIPMSPDNQAFFGPLFDVNYSGSLNYHKKAPAILQVDTVPIAVGHVQCKNSRLQTENRITLTIVFYAETPDLIKAIGTKTLADLDYTALDHEMTFTNITTGGTDYLYALTDRGQKWSENLEAGTRRVLNVAAPVGLNEMTCCVRSSWIWNKIITDAGFTWEGSTLQTLLEGYYVPYVNNKVNQTGIPLASYLWSVGITADQAGFTSNLTPGVALTSLVEQFDNSNAFASDVFTAQFDGIYRFKLWGTIDPSGSPDNEIFRLNVVRTDGTDQVVFASAPYQINSGAIQNFQYTTQEVFLGTGQTFQMFITMTPGLTVTLKADADPALGTGWALIYTGAPVAGEDISLAANAPDMTQADFLKSIAAMHNLAIIPDRNIPGKIAMIPLPEYLAAGTEKNWTHKIEVGDQKDIVITPTTDEQRRKLIFTYKGGNDVLSKLYQAFDRVYGDYQVTGYTSGQGAQPNDFAQGEMKVELAFASTPAGYINGTSIVIPKFVNETGDFVTPGPRILFVAGTAEIALYNEATFLGEMATINLINHYSDIDAGVQDFDLNFAPEQPLHVITGNPYGNLFNLYYRAYLNEIYSPLAFIMEAWFRLHLTDVLNFRFNDQIFIEDSWWRVLEIIDYKTGADELTKVKLIKILDIEILDCPGVPVSVSIAGVVNFEDANGDPIAATENCCIRYNYFWDNGSSVCYAMPGDADNDPRPPAGNTNFTGNSFELGNGENISPDSGLSIFAGLGLEVADGNPFTIAVGDSLKAVGGLLGVAMFGRNVSAFAPGLWFGGGYFGNDRSVEGRAQTAILVLSGEGSFASSGTGLEIFLRGESGTHLEIPNLATLACKLSVVVQQRNVVGGTLTTFGYIEYSFAIGKSANVASVTGLNLVARQNGAFTALSLSVETTSPNNVHRFLIADTGGSYPIDDIVMTGTLTMTQAKAV